MRAISQGKRARGQEGKRARGQEGKRARGQEGKNHKLQISREVGRGGGGERKSVVTKFQVCTKKILMAPLTC